LFFLPMTSMIRDGLLMQQLPVSVIIVHGKGCPAYFRSRHGPQPSNQEH
jgi:hypothetical protein